MAPAPGCFSSVFLLVLLYDPFYAMGSTTTAWPVTLIMW
jgi:hypothetical protein